MIETGLAQGRALMARTSRQRVARAAEPNRQLHRLLDEVAHNAAVLDSFDSADEFDLTPLLAASLQARAAAVAKDLARELRILAARCDDALAAAGARTVQPLPVATPPAFDPARALAVTVLYKPWFAPLGRWSVRWAVHRELRQRDLRASITQQLAVYVQTLVEWRGSALTQLERDFVAAMDRLRGEADRMEQDSRR